MVEVVNTTFEALTVEGGISTITIRITLEAQSQATNLGKAEELSTNLMRVALRELRKEYSLDDPGTYNNFLYGQDRADIINPFGRTDSGFGISAEVTYTFTYTRAGNDFDYGVVVAD